MEHDSLLFRLSDFLFYFISIFFFHFFFTVLVLRVPVAVELQWRRLGTTFPTWADHGRRFYQLQAGAGRIINMLYEVFQGCVRIPTARWTGFSAALSYTNMHLIIIKITKQPLQIPQGSPQPCSSCQIAAHAL